MHDLLSISLFWNAAAAFKKYFMYLFLERGEGREKEGEKHQCVRGPSVAFYVPPAGDLSGLCPGLESNQRFFGLQGWRSIH